MFDSLCLPPQIPVDHYHKQLLFLPSPPASTVCWSPSSSTIQTPLLAVGHSQGVSIYRQRDNSSSANANANEQQQEKATAPDNILDRAQAFRKRWSLEHVCSSTLGIPLTHISWAPTSVYAPPDSRLTLLAVSTDPAVRLIEFPAHGGALVTALGGTSGHASFINAVDSAVHPGAHAGLVVASVGDDCTLIIWQAVGAGAVPTTYALASPGVAVAFCRRFARRVLVAEEAGTVRVLDWLAGAGTLWLLNIYMGAGLSLGAAGLLVAAEWCGEDEGEGEGGRIVGITKGGEWAVWDLSRIEGGGRTVPVERGKAIHSSNVTCVRSHPSEPSLFAIGSKASDEAPALHIIDLALENQTNPHPIHSLPATSIAVTSVSWHPTDSVLAATLSSGALLLTRINDRSDGEKLEQRPIAGELILAPSHDDDDDSYSDSADHDRGMTMSDGGASIPRQEDSAMAVEQPL